MKFAAARVIRIFLNGKSALQLLGAVLMEQDETWSTRRKHFDLATYWEWASKDEREATTKTGS